MYNPMPHRIHNDPGDMDFTTTGGKPDAGLFGDYISLLKPDNTADMHSFAVNNLDQIIDSAVN